MIQLTQLMYFSKIAELRSMNKAAKELFVSQSSLSYTIRNMEEELNVRLLERTNRGIALTDEGYELLGYANNILSQMELVNSVSEKKKILSVSAYYSVAYATPIREFYLKNKDKLILINFEEGRLDKIVSDVEKSKSDFGIVFYTNFQSQLVERKIRIAGLKYEELGRDSWLVTVGPNNPLFHRKSVVGSELLEFPMIRAKDDYFSSAGIASTTVGNIRLSDLKKVIFCNDGVITLRLLQETDCFRFHSGCCVDDYKANGLHSIPVEGSNVIQHIGIIYREKERLSKLAICFIKELRHFFEEKTITLKKHY